MLLRIVLAGAALSALAAIACGGGGGDGTMTATGLITQVDAPTLTQLSSFTLHTDDDKTLVFKIAAEAEQQDPQNGFVPSHLRTHILAQTKVKITYRKENSTLFANRIEDIIT
jgi:hypothetical protein